MIRATFSTRRSRELCFDVENRPLAYWYDGRTTSEITAIAWKWRGEPRVSSLLLQVDGSFLRDDGQELDDGIAYLVFRDVLCRADVVYGHNIKHDLGLTQTGLLRRQLPSLPELRTSDTLRDYPKRKDMSASLENLAEMYHLDVKGKLHMSITSWERANQLKPEGVAKAHARVTRDVLLQELLRDKLIELGELGDARTWRPRR